MRLAAILIFCCSACSLIAILLHKYAALAWGISFPVGCVLAILILLMIDSKPRESVRDSVMFRIHRKSGKPNSED
ncbi:MAG: hypothetical protein H6510_06805 [Acidobacteria bacterium]|nr:hypothetical protein [Acidobacteriota bacterium]MCB9397503.1 hypothetical protein [Acidobacteriota bacterium]